MISYCISVYNRWSTFQHLLQSLSQLVDRDYEVVIADLGSTDVDLPKVLPAFKFPSVRCAGGKLAPTGKVNRSLGRNAAASLSNAKPLDILFFLDADMLVPPNFCNLVLQNVTAGECFFPVCYSLHQNKPAIVCGDARYVTRQSKNTNSSINGWWRKEGWGNCGFVRRDYVKLGGWDERIGSTYGGEDNNIRDRARSLFKLHRLNCPGFFHQWHPPNK
jgi:hypothetical protein